MSPAAGLKITNVTLLLVAFYCQALIAQGVKVNNIYFTEGRGFRWRVYLDEDPSQLRLIKCVEYTLFPSYTKPVREVCDPRDQFALEESGGAEFAIVLKIEWRDRAPSTQAYVLDLHSPDTPQVSKDPILRQVQPTSLALLESGALIIADRATGHILLQTPDGFQSIENLSAFDTVQLTSIEAGGGEAILAATNKLEATQPGMAWVFPPNGGSAVAFWVDQFSNKLVACTWDNNAKTLFLVDDTRDRPNLFALHFSGNRLFGPSGDIVGLDDKDNNLLIVADPPHKRLIAADKFSGRLYRVDLPNGHAHVVELQGEMGQPEAIALSADGQRLFSVDGSRIRMIKLDTTPAQVSTFLRKKNLFKSLKSLAIGPRGQIWVGDDMVHAIYIVSPQGQITGVLSGR